MAGSCFKYFLVISGCCIFGQVFSQQFGANPSAAEWKQLTTDRVRIIFPATWRGDAQRVAALADSLNGRVGSLGKRFRRFDIVLQNQTTISNAYVGIGPRRSEFFTTPLQNSFLLGSLPWTDQLLLHEFRHIHQFNNFNKGGSRLFYFLAGELGLSLINNAAVPNWFWEGDAVYQETRESLQGRGRLPAFFSGYRSLWLENKSYNWMKLRNGSLRDFVPDHYQLGYILTAYGTEKWGSDFWGSVTNDAVRFKGLIYPFQKAIQRASGLRYSEYIGQAFTHGIKAMDTTGYDYTKLAPAIRHFAGDQEFPHFVDSGSILFVSSSYRDIPTFTIKDLATGRERRVRVRDISLDNQFSYRNGKVVYAALAFDPRWAWRNYSEIRMLDIYSGQQQRVTSHTKYFSPDISADGSEIVAAEMAESGDSRLHILSATDGKRIDSFSNPNGWMYTYPKFMGKEKVVAAVRNPKGEMGLVRLHRGTLHADTLIPFSMHVIGFPQVNNDTVYVTASIGPSDRIFMVSSSGTFEVLPGGSRRLTGQYQFHRWGDRLAWVNFTSYGYRLQTGSWQTSKRVPIEEGLFAAPLHDFGYAGIHQKKPLLSSYFPSAYPVQKYPKTTKLINFHSWLPSWSDPEYSLTFVSENVLNTLQGEASFTFNRNEQSKSWALNGIYGGLFPWVRAGITYTADRSFIRNGQLVRWNQWEMRSGLLVPLNLSGGRSFVTIRAATDYAYAQTQYQGRYKDSFSRAGYGYLEHQFVFNHQIQQARQHIFPRIAQSLRLGYAHTVSGLEARQFLASGNLFFPGFHPNHHLVIQAAWQQRDTLRKLYFTNNFPFSRGYKRLNFHQMFRWAANYHLPIAYPDWGVASIVYLLRLRASAFYDHSRVWDFSGTGKPYARTFRSIGMELYFDTKWWNQHPVSFGLRYARLLDPSGTGLGSNQWELILPVNLIAR